MNILSPWVLCVFEWEREGDCGREREKTDYEEYIFPPDYSIFIPPFLHLWKHIER